MRTLFAGVPIGFSSEPPIPRPDVIPQAGHWRGRYTRRGRERRRAPLRRSRRRGAGRARRARDQGAPGPRRPEPGRSAQALRPPDRRRAPAHTRRGARARAPEGRGRRGRQAEAHRVEPPARDVHHPELHARRRPAARPDPGGQPRPHPRGGEVRLSARVQALDVRDVVDQAVDLARPCRAGPRDPPSRPRRRPGAQGDEGPPRARDRSSTAILRSTRSPPRSGSPRSASRSSSSSSSTRSAWRRRSETATRASPTSSPTRVRISPRSRPPIARGRPSCSTPSGSCNRVSGAS